MSRGVPGASFWLPPLLPPPPLLLLLLLLLPLGFSLSKENLRASFLLGVT